MSAVEQQQGAAAVALSSYWVYDLETYPNFFSAGFQNLDTNERMIFEISSRRDDGLALWQFLHRLIDAGDTLIGYNNLGFDYPVIHEFLLLGRHRGVTAMDLYLKAQGIIDAPRGDWTHSVPEWEHLIPQIDPFKIMHFDNHARSTSLKKLEVAMKSPTVKDLPIKPGTNVPFEMMDDMLHYMAWDISETLKFVKEIWDRIVFRMELDQTYGGKRSRMNYNDTRIGKEFFLDQLQQAGVQTKSGKDPRQTPRPQGIVVKDILLPIEFDDPDLQRIYRFYEAAVIPSKETKGFFTGVSATVRGFQMDFGAGGIHGSIHKKTVYSDDEYVIMDADVTSYYPSLAIKYGFYPEHLGETFVDIYSDLLEQRKSHPKGSAPNAMLKLALNGTYGESNNKFSSFYDPGFTMSITINGQLLLARLMEVLLTNEMVEPIQANTDGLTVRLPRAHLDWYYQVCAWWENWSRMDLEYAEYKLMAIRDVNNYVSISTDGKVKRKNAYLTEPDWHQDHSALVVPKAVDAFLQHGTPLAEFVMGHTDPWDFMMSVKVPRSARLFHGDEVVQNVTRYHIALTGESLVKEFDQGKPVEERRRVSIQEGWFVNICTDAWEFDWKNLNRPYYLREAEKLLAGLGL